jgi:hypothetical protein
MIKKEENFNVAITEMYPLIPRELVSNPLKLSTLWKTLF